MGILIALGVCLGIGVILGLLLAIADKYLAVKEDPRLEEVIKLLPGANCGGCGFAGCSAMAASLVEKTNSQVSLCKPCKPDNKQKIIDYLASTPGPDGSVITGIK